MWDACGGEPDCCGGYFRRELVWCGGSAWFICGHGTKYVAVYHRICGQILISLGFDSSCTYGWGVWTRIFGAWRAVCRSRTKSHSTAILCPSSLGAHWRERPAVLQPRHLPPVHQRSQIRIRRGCMPLHRLPDLWYSTYAHRLFGFTPSERIHDPDCKFYQKLTCFVCF